MPDFHAILSLLSRCRYLAVQSREQLLQCARDWVEDDLRVALVDLEGSCCSWQKHFDGVGGDLHGGGRYQRHERPLRSGA